MNVGPMSSHHIRTSIGRVSRWYFAPRPVADSHSRRSPTTPLSHNRPYLRLLIASAQIRRGTASDTDSTNASPSAASSRYHNMLGTILAPSAASPAHGGTQSAPYNGAMLTTVTAGPHSVRGI